MFSSGRDRPWMMFSPSRLPRALRPSDGQAFDIEKHDGSKHPRKYFKLTFRDAAKAPFPKLFLFSQNLQLRIRRLRG
jgi:hypothetical protein